MIRKRVGIFEVLAGVAALSVATVAQAGTVIVDDSFADGTRTADGPLQADFFSTTSSGGNSIEVTTGSLGLVSGNSGRGIRGVFPEQTLAPGETITATYSFTTPASVGSGSTSFRVALFDSTVNPAFIDDPAIPGEGGLGDFITAPVQDPADLLQDLSTSSGTPNPLYQAINGYSADYDVGLAAADSNIAIRERQDFDFDIPPAFINPDDIFAFGRLLETFGDGIYETVDSGGDEYTFDQADTDFVGTISISHTLDGELEITSSLVGGTVNTSFTTTEDSPTTFSFSQLAFHAGSGEFGDNNTPTDPGGLANNNGIEFTNIRIEVSAVPEPSSLMLAFAAVAPLVRRKRRS